MKRLLPILAIFLLSACASTEESIQIQIEEANYCDLKEDCVFVGSKCPFGCYIYVNTAEATRISTMVENYESQCVYSCIQSFGVDCIAHKCEPLTEPPVQDTDGNVGAACDNNQDCVTPMSYMMRSSCSFRAQCIQGSCAITCPIMEHDPNPDVSESSPVACLQDSDCTCDSYLGPDQELCSCIEGACVAIVKL